MAFTFELGATSSKAVSGETAAMQCISETPLDFNQIAMSLPPVSNGQEIAQNDYKLIGVIAGRVQQIIDCAKDNQ